MKRLILLFSLLIFTASLQAQSVSGDTVTFKRVKNATPYAASYIIQRDTTGNGNTAIFNLPHAGAFVGTASQLPSGGIARIALSGDTVYAGSTVWVWIYRDTSGLARFGDGATFAGDSLNHTHQIVAKIPLFFRPGSSGTLSSYADTTFPASLPYRCISGSTSLFARLTAGGAITPKNGGSFALKLEYRRDQ